MSRVRYVNKKTGWVSIYESTSCYDPVNKTSRPKRTYIGYEDPVTKEFVPSSGKPGRKKRIQTDKSSEKQDQISTNGYYSEYKRALAELNEQRAKNNDLCKQVASLQKQLDGLNQAVEAFIRSVQVSQQ